MIFSIHHFECEIGGAAIFEFHADIGYAFNDLEDLKQDMRSAVVIFDAAGCH